jgi:phage FluMu protein Com
MQFFDKEILSPKIHPIATCPSCKTLIDLNNVQFINYLEGLETKCPKCSNILDIFDLSDNYRKHFQLTQAISSANRISTFDIAVIIFVVIIVSYTFIFQLFSEEIFKSFFNYLRILNTLTFITPLILTFRWYFQHGKLKSNDADLSFR